MAKKPTYTPSPYTDLEECLRERNRREWLKAGKPELTPIEVLKEAQMEAYEHGGAIAASLYAKELAPYMHARLSAQANVTRDELKSMTTEDLVARLTKARK